MEQKTYHSGNTRETEELGRKLGEILPENALVYYEGGLGRGKTAMTRGIAQGLGLEDWVTSPTFTIVNEYPGGRCPLFHFDFYRLGESLTADFLAEMGFEEYFYRPGICVLEWGNLLEPGFLAELQAEMPFYWVEIQPGETEEERIIMIKGEILP